jgi:hypothetical protein
VRVSGKQPLDSIGAVAEMLGSGQGSTPRRCRSRVAVDQDWRCTYVNDRALARMGDRKGTALAGEDVLGQGMWEMFPEAIGTETSGMTPSNSA